MIKFFRKIRQRLLNENRFSKYLLYAIGEIVLVVIGILIALQINNWNESRRSQEKMDNYFDKILVEMRQKSRVLKSHQEGALKFKQDVNRIARMTADKNPDSIPVLKSLLGSLTVAGEVNVSFPIMDEFYKQDLQVAVANDSLKMQLERLLDLRSLRSQASELALNSYVSNIEPFYIKHINYSKTATNGSKEGYINAGPDTNYDELMNSMEFWNIVTLKQETNNYTAHIYEVLIYTIEKIIDLLENELKTTL
ncbi:DUF6090 family protein [Muricauda sp. 334s03]|uniref:DUF6090 family protein n=1 Tax=Flagellimonas yonaguniensis TaxID=3031325 RepID=A0ABT5Y4A5_9FLAO|nr:DUF6090 family protein [[Muricauda] yonaguniensis]MDF0718210.1 DUF6090 family protein [[Muricauda] yonaguniensis]